MESVEICSMNCKSKCCKSTQPALTSNDFDRINATHQSKHWFYSIKKEENATKVISKKEGQNNCFFLSEEGLCNIYDLRPLDCELFPIFFKIEKIDKNEYSLRWLVWYCPLTEALGIDPLIENARKKIEEILEKDSEQLFEYQDAMYVSQGYKRKHFLYEERLKIRRR